MRSIFCSVNILFVAYVLVVVFGQGCTQGGNQNINVDSLALRKSVPPSPALSAEESMKQMRLENGFAVKLVASEPLITAPVAIKFDERGRIWVVEMADYMPDTLGTGEQIPLGKIVILSDKDGDGIMDGVKVFLDSLVLPRAICLIGNGILVAEPPKLWYYEIKNDKPVNKTLVDSAYALGGNVEHQPNGLLRGLDNWIYNAKSSKRYRKEGDHWLIEKTHFRGQWGITEDDLGRLYYNTNSDNLQGDYFSPGFGSDNKQQRNVAGYVVNIVSDNRVYPIRPTPGVNRGYMKGVLDDSLRLVNFTAACGPVIYKGDLFGKDYSGNAFVAEPAGNLIKRDILTEEGYIINGREAYVNKEFLASKDERFRPVYLSNGPDGALYIVDMYRGIIQHKTYLTPYLKNEIKKRELTEPLSCGRIYKIVPQGKKDLPVQFSNDAHQLVDLFNNSNGWVSAKAQQLLIDRKDKQVVPALRHLLSYTDKPMTVIHSLWTLEGLDVLQAPDVLPLLKQSNWPLRMEALSLLPSILNKNNYQQFMPVLQQMVRDDDTLAAPYIAFLAHSFQPLNANSANQLLLALAKKYPENIYVADAIISNLENKEGSFYKEVIRIDPDTNLTIHKRLRKVMADIEFEKHHSDSKKLAEQYPKGSVLFQSACQTCHGVDGNGINALGPPLNNSNWVQGDKEKLISIVLYGLTGPIKVKDKLYKTPEINGEMPDFGSNKDISDEDIAQVLSFVRNSWANQAGSVTVKEVNQVRNKFKGRQKPFTMEELNQLK
ncbi:MAG: c-type cytochrome [Bacteroidetes bacterium]|nr:c-type cytochrome [Bacteroidota bacterium]